jgi:Concanavalin A-like lectin/glucanases superfamily
MGRQKINEAVSASSEKLSKVDFKKIPDMFRGSERNYIFAFLLVVVIYCFLGIYNLGKNDYRDDEFILVGITEGYSQSGEFYPWDFIKDDLKDKKYTRAWPHTIMVSFVQDIFGQSESVSRSVSVIFGLILVFSCYFICRYLLRSRYLAIIITLLFTINPYFLYYFRTVRMYAVLLPIFFILCFMLIYFFEKQLPALLGDDTKKKIKASLYVLLLFFMVYFNYSIHRISIVVLPAVVLFFVYYAIASDNRTLKQIGYYLGGFVIFCVLLLLYKPTLLDGMEIFQGKNLFEVENYVYLKSIFIYPFDYLTNIGLMVAGLPMLLFLKNRLYRNTMIFLYLTVAVGMVMFIYGFKFPIHYRYVMHINIIAIVLVASNLFLITKQAAKPILKYGLGALIMISAISIFAGKADTLYSKNTFLINDQFTYASYKIPYQTIIDNYDTEKDMLLGMHIRNYYLDDLDTKEYHLMTNKKKYTVDSLVNHLRAYPNGWITWERNKGYHLNLNTYGFIKTFFKQHHGEGIDDFGVEVYHYDSAMVQNAFRIARQQAEQRQASPGQAARQQSGQQQEANQQNTEANAQAQETIQNNFSLNLGSPFTMTFWYRANSEVPGPPFAMGNYQKGISIESRPKHAPGEIRFRYAANGKGHVTLTGNVNDGKWHQISYYHSGGQIGSEYGLAVDGKLVSQQLIPTSKDIKIKFKFLKFDGQLADFRIYSELLSGGQLKKIFNNGKIDPNMKLNEFDPVVHTFKQTR